MDYIWHEPRATGFNSPEPLKIYNSSIHATGYEGWRLFCGEDNITKDGSYNRDCWATAPDGRYGYVSIDFGVNTTVSAYKLRLRGGGVGSSNSIGTMMSDWVLHGSDDGVEWHLLDQQSGVTDWTYTPSPYKTFTLTNTVNYRHYRITALRAVSNSFNYVAVGQLVFGYPPYFFALKNKTTSETFSIQNGVLTQIQDNPTDVINHGLPLGTKINISEIDNFVDIVGFPFDVITYTDSVQNLQTTTKISYPGRTDAYSDKISLSGVKRITKIEIESNGAVKHALSVDDGVAGEAFKNGQWEVISNIEDGMTTDEINNLTIEDLSEFEDAEFLSFAHSIDENCEITKVELTVDMDDIDILAPSTSYSISYDSNTKEIQYRILKSGVYSVNYFDAKHTG